jgi:WXG100 family type VII secretion target
MASDGMLLVNFAALQEASDHIQKAVSKLTTDLDQLEHFARPLVESWHGEAREAYSARQEKWRSASRDLQSILQNIKGAVDRSAEDYLQTEKQATSRFQ